MLPGHVSTLVDLLAYRAGKTPGKMAFVFRDHEITYSQLWEGIRKFAAYLRRMKMSPGTRVLIVLPNGPDFFIAFYGTILAGGIAVPVFPDTGPERAASIASLCGAEFIVIHDTFPKEKLVHPAIILTVGDCLGGEPGTGFPEISPEDIAYIQYTSGSTGNPKGVKISHAGLLTNIRQMIAGFEIKHDDVFVSWLPAYHDMGMILMTMVPFYMGIPLVLLRATLRNIRNWLHAIERYRGTFTAAPDFAYRLCLLYTQDAEKYDLSSLRVALNAAEPVRAQTVRDFEERFQLKNVMTPAYGLAEATVGVSTWAPGTPIQVDKQGFVSVGRPFPGISIDILKENNTGEVGEILVQSSANTTGYWNNPGETGQLYYNNYIRTGDLGYLDEGGNLYIVGRKKSMIIQGGRTIAPREVEELIDHLPFVRQSAAVGIDTGGREGEQTYIFAEIRPKGETTEQQFFEMSVQIVRQFHVHFGFRPGKVLLVKPRTIPKTSNGKIQYGLLKENYLNNRYRDSILFHP